MEDQYLWKTEQNHQYYRPRYIWNVLPPKVKGLYRIYFELQFEMCPDFYSIKQVLVSDVLLATTANTGCKQGDLPSKLGFRDI